LHAIHLNVSRLALLVSLAALLATVAVLAAAARLGDVSLGGFAGGGKPAPVSAIRSVSPGGADSAFVGSPFVTPFRVSLPWKALVR
jgi:hypothetical protein